MNSPAESIESHSDRGYIRIGYRAARANGLDIKKGGRHETAAGY
jgi:hypothetical protein